MSTFEFSGAFNRSRTSFEICSASPVNMVWAFCSRLSDVDAAFPFFFAFALCFASDWVWVAELAWGAVVAG